MISKKKISQERLDMLSYLNMYFEHNTELRTIANDETGIVTRKDIYSMDDDTLKMAYDDARYEVRASVGYLQ